MFVNFRELTDNNNIILFVFEIHRCKIIITCRPITWQATLNINSNKNS
ncbi:MAG: hypothetical protein LBP59_17215 [Planctomycetaceae bacterium]|nr:hypothetical protein [Planctomycetaceae bacterium]